MEKKLVVHAVKFSPSSIFSKEDVLRIVESIDENPINIYKMEPVKESPTTSLFEYLGHAAGVELGEEVYRAAKQNKQAVDVKLVKTKTYEGRVMLYSEAFLKEYFESKKK